MYQRNYREKNSLTIVGINEKVGDKMSIVSGASGNRSNNPDKNEVGGQKIRREVTPVKLKEDQATHEDKVRTGKQ